MHANHLLVLAADRQTDEGLKFRSTDSSVRSSTLRIMSRRSTLQPLELESGLLLSYDEEIWLRQTYKLLHLIHVEIKITKLISVYIRNIS